MPHHPGHISSAQSHERHILWHVSGYIANNLVLSPVYERSMPLIHKYSPHYTLDNQKYIYPFLIKKIIEESCDSYNQKEIQKSSQASVSYKSKYYDKCEKNSTYDVWLLEEIFCIFISYTIYQSQKYHE